MPTHKPKASVLDDMGMGNWVTSQQQGSCLDAWIWSKKKTKNHPNSPFWPSFDGSCFFSAWFLLSFSCPVSPWPCAALCRCPERCLSSGPLTRTSEHFTAFMAHTSLPGRRHLFSGHLNSPFKRERGTVKERTYRTESAWLWLPPQSAVTAWEPTLIEFERAWKTQQTVIWVFAFEKSLRGAGSWSTAMLVLEQNTTRVPDFVLFLFRGPTRPRQTAGSVCLFTELSVHSQPRWCIPPSAAAILRCCQLINLHNLQRADFPISSANIKHISSVDSVA